MASPAAAPAPRPEPSRWRRRYLEALAAMILAAVLAKLLARESDLATALWVLVALATSPLGFIAVRWAWRKLTYRVGVRLLISYFLIGLTPIGLGTVIAGIAGYILVGQYATVRLSEELGRREARFAVAAHEALHELATRGAKAADAVLRRVLHDEEEEGLRLRWLIADRGTVLPSEGAEPMTLPSWAPVGTWRGPVVMDGTPGRAVIAREGDRAVAIVMHLDPANSRVLGQNRWFGFRSVATAKVKGGVEGFKIQIGKEEKGGSRSTVWVNGKVAPSAQVESGWLDEKAVGGSLWSRARLLWFWEMKPAQRWDAATLDHDAAIVTLVRVRIADATRDFFAPSANLSAELGTLVRVVISVFGSIYLVAVGFALVMILRVTRSTARLTRGARAVARGDLEHRIAVKRRDQLGDLAASFNAMTDSVRAMLAQVAEKERMAREMELAREIQSSLLPPSETASGPLSVVAYFRPAAEVGGDYFDVFPLAPGHLAVAVGDVAGHGLPTGLLMAMVKSAVAALIEEGRRGGELLARLNRLLLGQNLRQKMVSLAIAEVDAAAAWVEVTSAGHPPAVVIAADGAVEELLTSSLPLGHRWPDPPPCQRRRFLPGSRLVLYSDGLVEARDGDGEPFGYEALRSALERHRVLPAPDLLRALLGELDRHLGGRPPADDLTLVLVEHRAAAEP